MNLQQAINYLSEEVSKENEAAEIQSIELNYYNIAKIITEQKKSFIFNIVKENLKEIKILTAGTITKDNLIKEGKTLGEKKLRIIVDKITKNKLSSVKDYDKLFEVKKKILEEAKDHNSKLFSKIQRRVAEETKERFSEERIRHSITGSINRLGGDKYETIVKNQIKNKKNKPVKGLWTLLENMFLELYDVPLDTNNFSVVKSKSSVASFDLQVIYKTNQNMKYSFINIHCKFLMKKTSKTTMRWEKPNFKTVDLENVKSAIQDLVGDEKDVNNYIEYKKNVGSGKAKNYRTNVGKVFQEAGTDRLNKNIEAARTLLRISFKDIFAIDEEVFRSIDTVKIKKNKPNNYSLYNKNGDELFNLANGNLRTKKT